MVESIECGGTRGTKLASRQLGLAAKWQLPTTTSDSQRGTRPSGTDVRLHPTLSSPRRRLQLERRDSPSFDSPRAVHPTPPTIPLHPVHAYTIPRPTHESLSQSPPYSSLLTALNTHPTEPTFHSSPCPSLVTPNPPNLSITSDYVPLLLLLWNQ